VQRWRARSSAILTAIGTVIEDDPHLTVRLENPFVAPLRLVVDRTLRTPRSSHVLDGSAPTLIVHGANAKRDDRFDKVELVAIPVTDGRLYLSALLTLLAERGVNELQVEAGPKLCGSLLSAGLVDELLLYTAPVLLGDTARPLLTLPEFTAMSGVPRWKILDRRQIGEDTRLLLRP